MIEEDCLQNEGFLHDYEEIDEVNVANSLYLLSLQEDETVNISHANSISSSLSDDGYLHPYNNLVHNVPNRDENREEATDNSNQEDQEIIRNGG